MNEFALYSIIIFHYIFVLFVILTPFIGNNYFLLLYVIMIPFMMAHWIANDNNCALTLMEKKLREHLYGEEPDPDDCFMYNLIAPIYDFRKNNHEFSVLIYGATISLWLYAAYRLYSNYRDGNLSSLEDLLNK